jgi:hypothetical protein
MLSSWCACLMLTSHICLSLSRCVEHRNINLWAPSAGSKACRFGSTTPSIIPTPVQIVQIIESVYCCVPVHPPLSLQLCLSGFQVRAITNHNEVTYHFLRSIFEHLHITKGGAGGAQVRRQGNLVVQLLLQLLLQPSGSVGWVSPAGCRAGVGG